MSVSELMTVGLRAMLANQSAMQTVGHNIANAGVDGYSRQQAVMTPSKGQFTGAGYFGKGVDVETVTRSYNKFLASQAAGTRSQSEYDNVRRDQLARLESVFKGGEGGIGAVTGEFLNAMVDVASRPQDLAARQVVLARAGELAAQIASAAAEFETLQTGVTQDLKNSVSKVNELAERIALANGMIATQRGIRHEPNDLLDERDKLITELAGYVHLTTIPADDGTLGVFIGGGQRLVLGTQALPLQLSPDDFDKSRMTLALVEVGGKRVLEEEMLGAGSMGGLLKFQNDDLVAARNLLGQMASALATAVNDQQALGLNLGSPPTAGAPLFAVGSPAVMPADDNVRDASGNFVAQVSLTVDDTKQLVASEYRLQHDGVGWQLTRLTDGLVRGVVSGDIVDGLRIDLGSPAPATGDRFLLQPLTRVANSMARVLDDPRGLAAASPLTASLAATNTGTGTVASLKVVSPTVNPQLTASVSFTSDTGAYTWELRDRVTNALSSSGTGNWTAGQPIALNGFELQLAGVPRTGDAFTVAKTVHPEANNGNALAMVGLRDQRLVGLVPDGAGGLALGETLADAWASALAEVGVRVQGATSAAQMSSHLAASAKAQHTSFSGVNLDEEAAQLMQYQQGYQAAAKVMQIAQSLFDTLLDAAR